MTKLLTELTMLALRVLWFLAKLLFVALHAGYFVARAVIPRWLHPAVRRDTHTSRSVTALCQCGVIAMAIPIIVWFCWARHQHPLAAGVFALNSPAVAAVLFYAGAAGCCIAWRRMLLSPVYTDRKGVRSRVAIAAVEARQCEGEELHLESTHQLLENDRRRMERSLKESEDKSIAVYEAERRRLGAEVMNLKRVEGNEGAFQARDVKEWERKARAMKPADLEQLLASRAMDRKGRVVCQWVLISSIPALARADAKRQAMRAQLDGVVAREAETAARLQETRMARQRAEMEVANLKVRLDELNRDIRERKVVLR